MTDKSKYDIWGQATRSNPHSLYRQMREEDPAFRVIDGLNQTVWFFTRYEDSVAVLKDKRIIKNIQKNMPPDVLEKRFGAANSNGLPEMFDVINQHMLNQDPPDHTRLRALVHKAFTPARVRDLQPRIEQIANDLLDAMQEKTEGNLITDFALPLPITVISEMLGVPATDRDKFRHWTQVILSGSMESLTSIMEFVQYMNEMIEARRKEDTDDILSALVHVDEAGDKLNHMELLSMIFLLLVAGHETTVNLIANATLALLEHPEQLQKLRENPDLIGSSIEEVLRFQGPVDATLNRWAGEPIEWSDGRVIEAGDVMIPLLLAANRDPEVFKNPDTFDITRNPNPHIAFGHGIHFCLGAPLARMEGAIAVSRLLERFPNLNLNVDPDNLRWGGTILFHNLLELPLCYQ
jgi:cytochrome P450 PksS